MRCAPNQVGTPGDSTLYKIWHQKGQKPCHCSSLKSVRTQAKQCIRRLFHHQWHTPSLRQCPLPVVEIPAAGQDVYVLEDGEESGGYFEVRGG